MLLVHLAFNVVFIKILSILELPSSSIIEKGKYMGESWRRSWLSDRIVAKQKYEQKWKEIAERQAKKRKELKENKRKEDKTWQDQK